MTELGNSTMLDAPDGHSWPLTGIVKTQLALACVWAPYALGWLVVLAVASAQFVTEDDSLVGTAAANRTLGWELTYWCGVILGVVATPIALPKAWPAAARIPLLRRVMASLLGPAALRAAGLVTKRMGLMTATGSSLLMEPLVLVLCSLLAVALVWPILRADE